MSTRADFVVEGTVDLVLFGTEDRGEVGRHYAIVELVLVVILSSFSGRWI